MIVNQVKTPLAEFCQLARDGKIPEGEVRRLVDRYSRKKPRRQETMAKLIEKLRQDAELLDDTSTKAEALALIATFSHDMEDIEKAMGLILGSEDSRDTKARNLAVIVRILAEAGKVNEALGVAMCIKDICMFWYAEAIIQIARFSKDKSCLTEVHNIIKDEIRNGNRQGDLLADSEQVEAEIDGRRSRVLSSMEERMASLRELFGALAKFGDHEHMVHVDIVTEHVSSTAARFEIRAIIARTLAMAMK